GRGRGAWTSARGGGPSASGPRSRSCSPSSRPNRERAAQPAPPSLRRAHLELVRLRLGLLVHDLLPLIQDLVQERHVLVAQREELLPLCLRQSGRSAAAAVVVQAPLADLVLLDPRLARRPR